MLFHRTFNRASVAFLSSLIFAIPAVALAQWKPAKTVEFVVPAGTGVMIYLQLIADEWLPITAALIISTIGAMAVAGLTLNALTQRSIRTEGSHDA